MTTSVKELLSRFDQLTDLERQEFVTEILKRIIHLDFPPLSDEELVLNAEQVFLQLDQQESAYE